VFVLMAFVTDGKRRWMTSAITHASKNPFTKMRHCIYPGTFDPITYGHLDVLGRAAKLFDKVTMAIAHNPGKGPLFSAEERVEMIRPNLAKLPNVEITTFGGLLVDFAIEQKATAIIRGLRALSDFEFEFNMALMNRHLKPEIETLFVMPNELYSYTSSNLVKQVARYGGDVGHFVPANVAEALTKAFAKKQG
jgi:pantetheine-phosphate adenylyltransferase